MALGACRQPQQTGVVSVSMRREIVWKSDFTVDYNPKCVICWFDVTGM